jgi:hypothetical protein
VTKKTVKEVEKEKSPEAEISDKEEKVPTPKDKSSSPEIPTEVKLTAVEIVVTKKTVKEVEKEKTPGAEISDKEEKVPTPKDKSPTPEIPTEIKLTAEEIVVTKKTIKEVEKEKKPEAKTSDKEEKVPTPKDKSPTPEIPTEIKLKAEEIVVTKKTVKEVEKEKTPEAEISDKEEKVPTPKDKSPTPEIPTEIKLKAEEIVAKEETPEKGIKKEKTPEAEISDKEDKVPTPKDKSPTPEITTEIKLKVEEVVVKEKTVKEVEKEKTPEAAIYDKEEKMPTPKDKSPTPEIPTVETEQKMSLAEISGEESKIPTFKDKSLRTEEIVVKKRITGSGLAKEKSPEAKKSVEEFKFPVSGISTDMSMLKAVVIMPKETPSERGIDEDKFLGREISHKVETVSIFKDEHERKFREKQFQIIQDKDITQVQEDETEKLCHREIFDKDTIRHGRKQISTRVDDVTFDEKDEFSKIKTSQEYLTRTILTETSQRISKKMSKSVDIKTSVGLIQAAKDISELDSRLESVSPSLLEDKSHIETAPSSRASIIDTDSESSNLSSFIGLRSVITQKEMSSTSTIDSTSIVTEVPMAPKDSTHKGTDISEVDRKALVPDSKLEAIAVTATSQLDYDSTHSSYYHKKVDFTQESAAIDDYITSDEVSHLSSVLHSDSTKLSETDAELIFSETDSSVRIDTSSLHETTRARSDSYPSSIPEIPLHETEPVVVMKDDIIEVTLQNGFEVSDGDEQRKLKTTKSKQKTSEVSKVQKTKRKITKASPKLRSFKAESDADVSSDDDKFIHKTRITKSSTVSSKKTQPSGIPKLMKSTPTTISESTRSTHQYLKRRPKESEATQQRTVKKYDTRVHGYMQSTVSRDMKIDKPVKEKETFVRGTKSKKEMDRFNENLKSSLKSKTETKKTETTQKHTYQRTTISSERKVVSSREGTPVKSKPKKTEDSVTKSPKKKEQKTAVIDSNKYAETKSVKVGQVDGKATILQKSEVIFVRDSPKPSASPTKLKRTVIIDQTKKEKEKSSDAAETEKVVQFSDRIRSQSVIPSSYQELISKESKSVSPTSLPGSPVRVRSANGGTKVMTSEVFTRTQNYTGSIEVIYRQPYENLRKLASALKNETEVSLIDTTDSSLSESVALPSSPSDHDVSSDANGRFRSVSPTSPRKRKSLESIHESEHHRISDIIPCTEIVEEDICAIPRQLVMSQYQEVGPSAEERLSPIIDVKVVSPSRIKYQFDYEDREDEDDTRSGTATFVLPDTKAMSSHSMAFRIETRKEV